MHIPNKAWPLFLAACTLILTARASGQINLNGNWHSAEFGFVTVVQDGESVYVTAPYGDKCNRSVYLAGFLEGDKLSGTMWRCTEKELIQKCTHQKIYKIDFIATVSRSRLLFGIGGPETGAITIESQQLNPAFQMQYWNTSTCQQEKIKPLRDLVFRDDQRQINPSPTPPPTPQPPPPCSTAGPGYADWENCMLREFGLLDYLYPNNSLEE